ncbi:MAG: hypothetical protein BFD77_00555 [Pseudomonas sp. CO183]|nr:MAG: hypothetical protein BFD77_00555 [Pseudomonas sp. CO183]
MDINITSIVRHFRLFAAPIGLCFLGVIVVLVTSQWSPSSPVLLGLKPIAETTSLIGALAAIAGCLWVGWNLWLLYRWENGLVDSGCYSCAGPMRHLTGRYGDYSKCLMCGCKRERHH